MGGNDGTVIGGGKRTLAALRTVVYSGKWNVPLWLVLLVTHAIAALGWLF